MPTKGKRWWHIQFGTYYWWIPGDERGFRSKDHRIHSSGNYKNRPPKEEHKGLRGYYKSRGVKPVRIPRELRLLVAMVIARVLLADGHRVLVVSVGAFHVHAVAELPVDRGEYNQIMGKAKSDSSRAVKKMLPGRVWARGDRHDLIDNRDYQRNCFYYVRDKQGPTAAVWCGNGKHREAERE